MTKTETGERKVLSYLPKPLSDQMGVAKARSPALTRTASGRFKLAENGLAALGRRVRDSCRSRIGRLRPDSVVQISRFVAIKRT